MLSSLPTTMVRASSGAPASREPALQEVLGKTRDAIGCGNAGAAVHILSDSLGGDQHAFHGALLNLLDCAPGKMRQQLIGEARSQRTDFALDAHNREGKTALDLAVRHNDTEFADYLLRHGASPERTSLAGATHDMQTLVTRWRLKNLLYADRGEAPPRPGKLSSVFKYLHAGSGHGKWTSLDRALSKGSYKEADELLQKKAGGDSLLSNAMLWHKAMEKEQHDVLRAMLVLRPDVLRVLAKDKQEVGKWLDALRQDPGLSAALKEFPYQSAERGAPEILSGKVRFRSTAEQIVCRHLSIYQQEEQARDPKIKFDYGKFRSVEAIANNVQPEIEKTYETLKAQASATHLIDNSKFGQFLARQFQEMEGEDLPATRLMLVRSTNHTMNLGLMIKEKEGKKSYVVKFFDPNYTTIGTRSKASSVQTFEMQTIEDYLANEKRLADYYPEAKGLSMISVRPKAEEERRTDASTIPGSAAGRRLTTSIDIKDVDATAVWHFMRNGFDANLRELQGHFATLSKGQRLKLLEERNDAGDSALWIAMEAGHANAVKAYSELVRQAEMPEQHLIKLLEGKNNDGAPALMAAMDSGHAEAIKAYGEVVKSLPPDMQADLLLAKASTGPLSGESGFVRAMKHGHFGAANAQLQLLVQLAPSLSEGKRAELQKELQDYKALFGGNKMRISRHKIEELRKVVGTFSKLKAALSNDQAIHE